MEQRVLVLATSGQDAQLSCKLLAAAGLAPTAVKNEFDFGAQLAAGVECLMVAEEALTPRVADVLRRYVAQQEAWSDLPILLVAKHGADSLQVQRAIEQFGNVTVMERPLRTNSLISAARAALRARDRQYQVRALDRRKDEFLATLAHELRNPLSPIVNAVSIIGHKDPTDDTQRLVRMIDRQVNHLTRLIDDLMDVARITSGKLQVRFSETSVRRILAQAVEIATGAIQEREQALHVVQPEQDTPIFGDHVRLVQTLANLLTNASKFTARGGNVWLSAEVQGARVALRVRDDGRGIAKDKLDSIFDMFDQGAVSPEERTRGLGIGLHLAKAFVGLHDGTIRAHSEGLSLGSEFVIDLPVAVPEAASAVAVPGESETAQAVAEGSGESLRFLVVDDNEDAARTLASLLELEAVQAQWAADGASALRLLARQPVSTVVLDIGMPGLSGYEVAREIVRTMGERRPRLIALTGWGQYTDKVLAQEAGFDHHFVKPVDVQQLLAAARSRRARPAED